MLPTDFWKRLVPPATGGAEGGGQSQGVTLAQPALAWLPAHKDYIVPIPGSHDPDRVAQSVAETGLTLTVEDLSRIAEIAPEGGHGERLS
ncbi:aldo/keto reductase [Streptomyces sp. NPDC021080]|uniref:aldo/keto reductase n=1 Tax=Streptomyces sp. NPDC021080 TaxID=3365110 RepID=UPI00378B9FBE